METVQSCKYKLQSIRHSILHRSNYKQCPGPIKFALKAIFNAQMGDEWHAFYNYLLHLNSIYVIILESKV